MRHDPDTTPNADFPHLTPTNHRIIGPATESYNCIGWAAHDSNNWWQPGSQYYWPWPATEAQCSVDDLVAVFSSLGFAACPDGELETGFEKVAIYARRLSEYTHAARQLPSGQWTSKLGPCELIEHDTPKAVAGGAYGEIAQFMKRPLPIG
jgi:hypothetical protein